MSTTSRWIYSLSASHQQRRRLLPPSSSNHRNGITNLHTGATDRGRWDTWWNPPRGSSSSSSMMKRTRIVVVGPLSNPITTATTDAEGRRRWKSSQTGGGGGGETMTTTTTTTTPTNKTNGIHDRSISIGDISVDSAFEGSGRPDLIPSLDRFLYNNNNNNNDNHYHPSMDVIPSLSSSHPYFSHLRWMVQKDFILQQDFVLLGPPGLARDRRHLIFLYAALVEREVEYMALSRDTSDADLKQRKEVSSLSSSTSSSTSTSSSIYTHQAPVRAALHGRLFILDGLEKAERNVLPTLNNLLENREMSLDDGGFLIGSHIYDDKQYYNDKNPMTTIHRVHPDFRVAALTSDASALDPPLRSRFQARGIPPLDPGDVFQSLMVAINHDHPHDNNDDSGNGDRGRNRMMIDSTTIHELIQMASSIPDDISLQTLHDAVNYLQNTPNTLSPQAALNPYKMTMLRIQDRLPSYDQDDDDDDDYLTGGQQQQKSGTNVTDVNTHSPTTTTNFIRTKTTKILHDFILSAFESGKRGVALVGPKGCYKSALVRDLAKNPSGTGRGEIRIRLFSLYSDMTARDLLLTRGTDAHGTTVWRRTPLTRAIETGTWVILDGIDKINTDTLTSLALLLEQGQVDLPDGTRLIAGPDFRCIALAHPHDKSRNPWLSPEVMGMFHFIQVDPLPSEELKHVLSSMYPWIDSTLVHKMVQLRDRLDEAIRDGAADTVEEKESFVLSMRKLKHVCKRVMQDNQGGQDDLRNLLENAMMIDLMPDREKKIVQTCMEQSGLLKTTAATLRAEGSVTKLDEDLLKKCRRTPQNLMLVPNPVFEENDGHTQVMADILAAHSVGEEALLIMGFQGVGKNRVVDHLLSLLSCEREYLQLHRDTTVQSMLSSPSVEDGRIVYHDSPLVRASKHGRILVIDEADKAPVEVVALLKGLIEDRELALPDGRTLRYIQDCSGIDLEGTIEIHPDFRIWALANPATYPFHGNDISGEMSDVFSCHTVPPLDSESQRRILQRYGPDVSNEDIEKIIETWRDLRTSYERGVISYPFSVREAVSITKHLNRFPSDGLSGAFENVIAFDRFDSITLKQLVDIFGRRGVPLERFGASPVERSAVPQGGISTPRTRASSPKHGRVDENNEPHVGGNTWAGGTGGSDTAGLGGRGGPYRLDSGHPVHQVSDEMKAQVSQEALRRARELAREGLERKLKELDMNKLDWERYSNLQARVAPQIQQLRVHLGDIQRRKQERIWLKRQSTGELDDSRLVDALAGERDVFKKRGKSSTTPSKVRRSSEQMSMKLVVDISASMYRFNGYDGRLQTLLEATLMIMEALKDDDRFSLTVIGHNGDSPEIPLLQPDTPRDPKRQLKILEGMVAHTQYTFAGDNTVEAVETAVSEADDGDLILIISDANLRRYRINPEVISRLLNQPRIHAHLVLIGNFGEEARDLASKVANERAQVCLNSEDLPLILKKIVASAAR